MLAGLIRSPSYLAPTRNIEEARERARLVLRTMVDNGFITEATAGTADLDKVKLAVDPDTNITEGSRYFADWIAAETRETLGPLSADLTVQTTLNVKLQGLAETTLRRWLDAEGEKRNAHQGAMVVLDHEGAVLAMVGDATRRARRCSRPRAICERTVPGGRCRACAISATCRPCLRRSTSTAR